MDLKTLAKWRKEAAIVVALGIFAINLRAMAPTITAGDSAELSTAQTTLGIAHSPGYPFFVLTGKAFTTLIPWGNHAYRTNLFSVFLSLLVAIFLFHLLLLWTNSVWLAAASTFFFLFVPVIREQFLTTEVFALNLLVVVVILFLVSSYLAFLQKQESNRADWIPAPRQNNSGTGFAGMTTGRIFCLVAFIFGLGMGNQHTLILLVPSLALIYILSMKFKEFTIHHLLFTSFFFLLGLSLYLFLPIRSFVQPLLDWEDPQTWERFWGVLTRARYGTFQLAQGQMAELSFSRLIDITIFLLKELWQQMTMAISLVLFVGIVLAFIGKDSTVQSKGSRWFAFSLFLLFLFSGPFFLMLSNVGTGPSGYEILSRFLPMPFLAFFLMGIMGFSSFKFKGALAALLLSALFFLPSLSPLRNHFLVYDYGRNVLKTLPEKSLLFADRADEVEFSLAYLLYAEARRKDIKFIDCNAGVTRSIYGEDYYKIWGKPRLAIREMKEKELIQKSPMPVYYATVEPEMIAIPRRGEGILFVAEGTGFRLRHGMTGVWDKFYLLRYDLRNLGFRGVPLLSTYAQLLGNYFLSRQNFETSKTFFQILALTEPSSAWNHSIALQYMAKEEAKLAEEFFLKALRRGPEKDKVLCNFGILYERMGRISEAKESYREAIKLNPNSAQAHYNLGVLYWKESKWQEVVQEFEAVLKIEPNHSDAKRYLQIAMQRISQ